MTQTVEPETLAVFSHPQYFEVPRGMDPEAFENPHKHAVWDMAMGATLTVSATEGDEFRLILSVSDQVQDKGIMVRTATEAQVAGFAHHLLRTIGGGAHELAANLREALTQHEQLVEHRARNVAEQVVEPLRQILTAQIKNNEEAHTARAQRFSDVEDELRAKVKALAAENGSLQRERDAALAEIGRLAGCSALHGHNPFTCDDCEASRRVDADEAPAVSAQDELDGGR